MININKYTIGIFQGKIYYYCVFMGGKLIEHSRIYNGLSETFYLYNLATLYERLDVNKSVVIVEKRVYNDKYSQKVNFKNGYNTGVIRGLLYNNFNNVYYIPSATWKQNIISTHCTKEEINLIRSRDHEKLADYLDDKDYRDIYLKSIKRGVLPGGRKNNYFLIGKLGIYRFLPKKYLFSADLISCLLFTYWGSNFMPQVMEIDNFAKSYNPTTKAPHTYYSLYKAHKYANEQAGLQ